MSDVKAKRRTKSYWINTMIVLALMLLGRFVPPIGSMTPFGMEVLGIFLGAIYGWCTVELIWPSIFGLSLLGLSDYTNVSGAFSKLLSNETIMIVLFVLPVASLVSSSGLGEWVANKLLSLKISQGRPWVLSGILLLTAAVATLLIKIFPAMVVCWQFLFTIAAAAGMEKRDKYIGVMIVGITFVASMASAIVPWYIGTISSLGFANAVLETPLVLPAAGYMASMTILTIVSILLYILVAKYILRVDVSALKSIDISKYTTESQSLTKKQKAIAIYFAAFVFVLLGQSVLPKAWMLTQIMAKFGVSGTIALFIALATLITVDGQPLGTPKEMFGAVMWEIIFMVGAAIVISGALVDPTTGLRATLSAVVTPMLNGYSPYMFLAVAGLVSLFATNLINNVAVTAVMIPVCVALGLELGCNPLIVALVLASGANIALVLPSGSPAAAMMHGQREYMSATEAIKYATVAMLVFAFELVVIGIPVLEFFL